MYKAIMIDPPWPHVGGGKRGAQEHYPVLKVPQIIDTILSAPCWAPDVEGCHIWLWCPNNWIPEGLLVMQDIGARYITMHTWAKDRFGIGQYGRGQTEQLLVGDIYGPLKPLPTAARTSTLVGGRLLYRAEHSRKPDEVYQHIESISPSPRLEMFARRERPGWDVWGNEVEYVPYWEKGAKNGEE